MTWLHKPNGRINSQVGGARITIVADEIHGFLWASFRLRVMLACGSASDIDSAKTDSVRMTAAVIGVESHAKQGAA